MNRISHLGSAGLLTITVVLAATSALAEAKKTRGEALPEVVITADKPVAGKSKAETLATPLSAFTLSGAPIAAALPATNDTAALLDGAPGVATAAGGGVSSLPVIHGFADDQINVITMGMAITSACGNHMNPPMSYIDPSRVGSVEVLSGVVPVSKGGNSTGGTIIVEPKAPQFAGAEKGIEVHGGIAAYYRSNGNGLGGSAFASVADKDWSLQYDGAGVRAQDYKAGGGAKVLSTLYASQNHALTLARRLDNGLFTVSAGVQDIPYQGFPNVRMDMIYNRSTFANARYEGGFDWGRLDARVYWQHTEHYMNFLADKYAGIDATPAQGMPMYTKGDDLGWSVKGTIDLGRADTLRLGNELQHTTLDDWWPAVDGKAPMMGPNTFQNINGGRRDRLGTFAEWEHIWSKEWSTLIGVRNDTVWMDTGNVVGYSPSNTMGMMVFNYLKDSTAFNARSHAKTDVNFDLTAMARWKPNDMLDGEFGYSRKTRSPNFYERYAWSTGTMAASMTSWFGDANAYVGDIDLKPEVAHTISATFGLHDAARRDWEVKVTPYYSYVENYIDVDKLGTGTFTDKKGGTFAFLKFANHDASLWGFDASARKTIWTNDTWGRFGLGATLAYVHGENLDTHDGLYRVMPLNAKLVLDHKLGDWGNMLELQLVAEKSDVSTLRREIPTAGYALVNYRTNYQWRNVRFDLGIDNILDQKYALPLGGVAYADYNATGKPLTALPGQGRSIYGGVAVKF